MLLFGNCLLYLAWKKRKTCKRCLSFWCRPLGLTDQHISSCNSSIMEQLVDHSIQESSSESVAQSKASTLLRTLAILHNKTCMDWSFSPLAHPQYKDWRTRAQGGFKWRSSPNGVKQNYFARLGNLAVLQGSNSSNIPINAELEVLSHVGHADSGSISIQPIKDFAGVNSSFWTKQRLEESQLNQPQGWLVFHISSTTRPDGSRKGWRSFAMQTGCAPFGFLLLLFCVFCACVS